MEHKKTAPLRKMDKKELDKQLAEKREALRAFRFGMKGSRTRNTKEGRELRKEVARILTLRGQRSTMTNEIAE